MPEALEAHASPRQSVTSEAPAQALLSRRSKGKGKGKGAGKGKGKSSYGSTTQHAPRQASMACMHQLRSLEVEEQASLVGEVSAALGFEVVGNRYTVYAPGKVKVFVAAEETDLCTRQLKSCFPDCAPWHLSIVYAKDGRIEKAFDLERDWTCTCCCFNRPRVEVKDSSTGRLIGSITDPWACFDLTFTIRDARDNTVLKAAGDCCQCGLCCPLPCGPCSEVNFPIVEERGGREVGHIQKQVPSCCAFMFVEDIDNYKIDFAGISNPEWKALVMGLSIFMDFRYFSSSSADGN
ncbi:unnamed protein product [Prorocentrum cordatum]|uniref:Phospholipid scramblase n=1 Tax=Prorocentrum cordatum TaxID=2364126 RepID=A0ABN9XIP8_9DINO|nr:unnamed protein product [Polarella glacialis]|mmetsp:Transcript_3098/g.8350  ORF Transcript_3098/g.8350 Transcript_3098/m.8350 type:complete len:293 (-) Transcript_3098:200-1078(-)